MSKIAQQYTTAIPMPQPGAQVPLPSVVPRRSLLLWPALAAALLLGVLLFGALRWLDVRNAPHAIAPAALDAPLAAVTVAAPPAQSASAWRVVYQDADGYAVSEYATQDAAMDAFLASGRTGAVLAPLGWVAQGSVSARRGWTYQAAEKKP